MPTTAGERQARGEPISHPHCYKAWRDFPLPRLGAADSFRTYRAKKLWCGVAQLWCGVAQLWCGVAQEWCGVAQLWCGVAQFIARRLAVRQARVRFSARHHREVFPTEHTSDEDMERDLGKWRWINVLYNCDWMNECMYVTKIWKNKQKEWHPATKPFKKFLACGPEFSVEFSAPPEFSGGVTKKYLSTGWARTFDRQIMRQVCYHCATASLCKSCFGIQCGPSWDFPAVSV